ncbi:MAG TPA: ribosome biogenesis GTPase Der [Armatimonadetes bacterium]|nr:ribosome biogenesis GTPase Der [Armatimonadota bacterium]
MARGRVPLVAIVGRANVGKSTLFNRLIKRKAAVVHDKPGVTRDRIYGTARYMGHVFDVVDTGGIGASGELEEQVRKQAQVAVEEADVIVLLTDGIEGLHPIDEELADMVRKSGKPVILAVNKMESPKRDVSEFYRLGLGEPFPISALHGTGVEDLCEEIVSWLPKVEPPEEEAVHIAIVGRPNVGKSSILNAIVGEERAIVHEQPGTTRDAIDTPMTWDGQRVVLIDTAGVRRRSKVKEALEYFCVVRALRAIRRCDVALVVIDSVEGVTDQDKKIAGYAEEEGKGIVLVANKWDLVKAEVERRKREAKGEEVSERELQRTFKLVAKDYERIVREGFWFLPYAPVVLTSAVTGEGIERLIPTALRVQEERRKRVPTGRLNRVIQEAVASHQPPPKGTKRGKIYYATQPRVEPPTFVFFVNDPDLFPQEYLRYLERKVREAFGFEGTPIKFVLRGKKGKVEEVMP